MRQRNPARRFSKAALTSSRPRSSSWISATNRIERKATKHAMLLEALADEVTAGERPACDQCGRPMVMRKNRTDGSWFWGCTGWPDHCKATKPGKERRKSA